MKQGTWTQRSDGVIELRESNSSKGGSATPKEAAIFFAIIALIIALIFLGVHLYKNGYSPDTINVELVSIEAELVPSKSPYSDGTRYLYLGFDVGTKKHKVDAIDLYLNVSDAAGNDLGKLSVSLGGDYNRLELTKGDKQNIELSWNDDNLYSGNEDIFEILYNADYSDLTFTYDIWRIEFSNDYVWIK